jgi:hypothetical protein
MTQLSWKFWVNQVAQIQTAENPTFVLILAESLPQEKWSNYPVWQTVLIRLFRGHSTPSHSVAQIKPKGRWEILASLKRLTDYRQFCERKILKVSVWSLNTVIHTRCFDPVLELFREKDLGKWTQQGWVEPGMRKVKKATELRTVTSWGVWIVGGQAWHKIQW